MSAAAIGSADGPVWPLGDHEIVANSVLQTSYSHMVASGNARQFNGNIYLTDATALANAKKMIEEELRREVREEFRQELQKMVQALWAELDENFVMDTRDLRRERRARPGARRPGQASTVRIPPPAMTYGRTSDRELPSSRSSESWRSGSRSITPPRRRSPYRREYDEYGVYSFLDIICCCFTHAPPPRRRGSAPRRRGERPIRQEMHHSYDGRRSRSRFSHAVSGSAGVSIPIYGNVREEMEAPAPLEDDEEHRVAQEDLVVALRDWVNERLQQPSVEERANGRKNTELH